MTFTFQPTLETLTLPSIPAEPAVQTEVKTSARRIELKPATAPRRQKVKSATTAAPAAVPSTEPAPSGVQVKKGNEKLPRTFRQSFRIFAFTGCKDEGEELTREDASLLISAMTDALAKHPEGCYLTDPIGLYVAKKCAFLADWVAHGACLARTKEERWAMEGRTEPPAEPKPAAAKPRRVKKVPVSNEEELRMMVMRNVLVADKKHLERALEVLTK